MLPENQQHPALMLLITAASIFMLTTSIFAASQEYTGVINQVDDKGSGIYVEIPVNISSDSEVSLYFGATCDDQNDLEFRFNTTTNPNGDDFYTSTIYGTAATVQPKGYYPMKAGQYLAMVFCRNQRFDPDEDVLYTVEVETAPLITPSTAEDQEPDPTYERSVTSSTAFSGWLGLMGNPGAGYVNPLGQDSNDMYMLNMAQGTDIQFKLEFDNFRSSNGGRDLGFKLRLYRWKNDKVYFVTEYDPILQSGQVTHQINLLESGAYKFYVATYHDTLSEAPTDNWKYGGYTVTVIVNGEETPDVKIGGVHKISTRYWSDDLREYLTREELVPGAISNVDILIANYGSQLVPVTLVYGLSVRNGPITPVGSAKLNIAPGGGSFAVYNTTLLTPANTPLALTGDLVVVLYGSANEVLDTFTTKVDLFSSKLVTIVPMVFRLLLEKDFSNPQVDD